MPIAGYKKADRQRFKIRVNMNEADLSAIAADAEKAGFRRGGTKILQQKPHGFEGEKVLRAKGIASFLRFCWQYWREHEADRLHTLAQLAEQEKAIAEAKKRLGAAP